MAATPHSQPLSDVPNHAAVEASLNYIADVSEKPVYYAYEPPPGVARQTGSFEARSVPVQDGRPFLEKLSLDREGFEVRRNETIVKDFYDPDEVSRVTTLRLNIY